MLMFLALHPMESILPNQSDLLEHLATHVADFNTGNKLLTQKLLIKQGYRYHKLRRKSKSYYRYYDLISQFHVGLKSLVPGPY